MMECGLGVGLLRFAVQLSENDDGNIEFHGEGFEAARDFGDFDLAVILGSAGT